MFFSFLLPSILAKVFGAVLGIEHHFVVSFGGSFEEQRYLYSVLHYNV